MVNDQAQEKRKVPEGAHTVGMIYRKITLGPEPVIRRFAEYPKKVGYVRLYLDDTQGIIEVARKGYDFHAFFDKEGNILNMSSETLGQLRESETGYGKIWNEEGKSFFQPFAGWNDERTEWKGQIVEITQQNIDDVAAGIWNCEEHEYDNHFDGASSVGNIIWSWGPCDKFKKYLKSNGQLD